MAAAALNMHSIFWILSLWLACLSCIAAVTIPIVDEEVMKPQDGQICGFGDMNKDRYTDLIVQSQTSRTLTVMLQSENGRFTLSKFPPITLNVPGSAVCAVADFNGDALPDIMVTSDAVDPDTMHADIYINDGTAFRLNSLPIRLLQPPSVVDINGDGIADIVGFTDDKKFFCAHGDSDISAIGRNCSDSFIGHELIRDPYLQFPHIFVDITGDMVPEMIFATKTANGMLKLVAWELAELHGKKALWRPHPSLIPDLPNSGVKYEHFGSGVVADFDGDGRIDLIVPICRERECRHVEFLMIYSPRNGWASVFVDLKDAELLVEKTNGGAGGTVFRVGDFTLDGFPDLIATVNKANQKQPIVFENVENPGNTNFSRKFEMMVAPKTPQIIYPTEMTEGNIRMAAFFDLKEDGNLDMLVEYTDYNGRLKFDFIKCDDKGDTTFLKVQIFTNVCTRDCHNSAPNDLGSGISWHGACATFTMPDSYGNTRQSAQCQLPQTSQRALHSPYLLFGLGRSPNFIDEVRLGSPRTPDTAGNQQSILKQIVPNSRIVVVPPEGEQVHWLSRLYLTPSRLIIQSVAVLVSVCVILIILIVFLHYRERQQDRKERQAQLHRFHFDAM